MGNSKSKPTTSGTQACIQFKFKDIQKFTNWFDESSLIGAGGFGKVYKAKIPIGTRLVDVAIKRRDPESTQEAVEFYAEVDTLSMLRHSNIVNLIGYCHHVETVKLFSSSSPLQPVVKRKEEMILVYERMPNKTLKEHLHQLRTPLSCLQRLKICLGVARGLYYLHTADGSGYIHRDIKSSNVVFDIRFTPVISDFGLCVRSDQVSSLRDVGAKGTFGYLDKTYAMNGILTSKVDVFSFGMLMLEMLFRRLVFNDKGKNGEKVLATWIDSELETKVLEDIIDLEIREDISPDCLRKYFETAQNCLHDDPDMRPPMIEVVALLESLVELQERYDNLKTISREFRQACLTDEGRNAKVFSGWVDRVTHALSDVSHGIPVAIKMVHVKTPWLEEGNFLGELAHSNIIKLLGRCKDGDDYFLMYERLENALSHFIYGNGLEPLPWKSRIQIMIGVASALVYLYSKEDILCHFQCEDVLMDEYLNPRIGGSWWAKHGPELKEIQGKIWFNKTFGYQWAANHTTDDLKLNRFMGKDDIHCFGLMLLEIITGRRLSGQKESFESVMKRIAMIESNSEALEGIMDPHLKGDYNPEGAFKCVTLALSCLAEQPGDKPSREGILNNLGEILALG